MKKLLIFTSLLMSFLMLVSCTYEVHPTQLVERQGQMYEINSTNPFTGSSAMYYDNGQLYYRKNYVVGILFALEQYHPNGQLNLNHNYRVDGYKHGYDAKGALETSTSYKNGKMDGPDITWLTGSRNFGKEWYRYNYKNGKKHGLAVRYTNMNNGDHELTGIKCYENGERIDDTHMVNTSECKVD